MRVPLIPLLIVPLLAGCAVCTSLLTSQAESWGMIQSVGGLRVDDPVTRPDGRAFLPVICNVSGLETISVRPTMVNSALAVRKTAAWIRDGRIQIQIVTCVVDDRHTPVSKGVGLGKLAKGRYQVEYLNPDGSTVPLRQIDIR